MREGPDWPAKLIPEDGINVLNEGELGSIADWGGMSPCIVRRVNKLKCPQPRRFLH
jgi:hypothetical protein